jgi:excisionase family DNA binding protein
MVLLGSSLDLEWDVTERKLLTIEQAAEVLEMSPSWVKQQIREGHLTPTRLGRNVRVYTVDLEEFINQHRCGKTVGITFVPGESPEDMVSVQVSETTRGVR